MNKDDIDNNISITPNDKTIISAKYSGCIEIYTFDVENKTYDKTILINDIEESNNQLIITYDGKYFISLNSDNKIRIWKVLSGKCPVKCPEKCREKCPEKCPGGVSWGVS